MSGNRPGGPTVAVGMTDEKREEGLWWVRWADHPWSSAWVEGDVASGFVYRYLNTGRQEDVSNPMIEWGPYLSKGPLGSDDGLGDVAYLRGDIPSPWSVRTQDEAPRLTPSLVIDIAQALKEAGHDDLAEELVNVPSPERGEFIRDTVLPMVSHPLNSAGAPASPQGLKGTTQLDGGPGSLNRHMEAVDTSGMGKAHVRAAEEEYGVTLPVAAKVPRGGDESLVFTGEALRALRERGDGGTALRAFIDKELAGFKRRLLGDVPRGTGGSEDA